MVTSAGGGACGGPDFLHARGRTASEPRRTTRYGDGGFSDTTAPGVIGTKNEVPKSLRVFFGACKCGVCPTTDHGSKDTTTRRLLMLRTGMDQPAVESR